MYKSLLKNKKQSYREIDTDFESVHSLPSSYSGQGWARPKLGTWNLVCVSLVGSRDLGISCLMCCSLGFAVM